MRTFSKNIPIGEKKTLLCNHVRTCVLGAMHFSVYVPNLISMRTRTQVKVKRVSRVSAFFPLYYTSDPHMWHHLHFHYCKFHLLLHLHVEVSINNLAHAAWCLNQH